MSDARHDVDTADVQSLVFSSHARLRQSVAMRLRVADAGLARAALRGVVENHVNFGVPPRGRENAAQLLVSAEGLRALGVPEDQLAMLDRPFQQGVVMPHRSRALGDLERNDPTLWRWNDENGHAWLFVYAESVAEAVRLCDLHGQTLSQGWVEEERVSVRVPGDGREPFGFLDGIGRHRVDVGDGRDPKPGVELFPPGEMILGYRNALGVQADVPDLAKNGSYVVVRQLAQDVEGFWRFWRQEGGNDESAVWLASKAVGRWPNGMPVSGGAPHPQPPYDEATVKGGLSFRDDLEGDRCPLGAHIRRANPRDGFEGGAERSLTLSGQHRILRRGRVYGALPPTDWLPAECRPGRDEASEPGEERGLLFVALCGDIARQFEFVQQTWLNNPKFAGHYDEVDAIAAGDQIQGDEGRFSIPRDPLRLRVSGVRRWVSVCGGGYYLMPGRRAILSALST